VRTLGEYVCFVDMSDQTIHQTCSFEVLQNWEEASDVYSHQLLPGHVLGAATAEMLKPVSYYWALVYKRGLLSLPYK